MNEKLKALYMGWNPESGFEEFILWDMFAEQMIMYILGLGTPVHRHIGSPADYAKLNWKFRHTLLGIKLGNLVLQGEAL